MKLVSPFSKTTLICGVLLVLVAVLGFTTFRAHYIFSVLNEDIASAVVKGFSGEDSIGFLHNGSPSGFTPLVVVFGFFTLPFFAILFGVFPGMPWGYGVSYHILPCVAVSLFIMAAYTIYRNLSDRYRNGMLWFLVNLWGLYGLFCYWDIEALMGV